jgi:hypothetical protein
MEQWRKTEEEVNERKDENPVAYTAGKKGRRLSHVGAVKQ